MLPTWVVIFIFPFWKAQLVGHWSQPHYATALDAFGWPLNPVIKSSIHPALQLSGEVSAFSHDLLRRSSVCPL